MCENTGIYVYFGPSSVLITKASRNSILRSRNSNDTGNNTAAVYWTMSDSHCMTQGSGFMMDKNVNALWTCTIKLSKPTCSRRAMMRDITSESLNLILLASDLVHKTKGQMPCVWLLCSLIPRLASMSVLQNQIATTRCQTGVYRSNGLIPKENASPMIPLIPLHLLYRQVK